jgi:hypothetical protein
LIWFSRSPLGAGAGVEAAFCRRNPLGDRLSQGNERATTIGQAYTRIKEILGAAETE